VNYDITLKRGDTRTVIKAIMRDSEGTPIDLTGCEVTFRMAPYGQPATIDRPALVHDAVNGEVWVIWQSGETDTVGGYRAEFLVTYPDKKRETFPNGDYLNINILSNLRRE
jgi:hypothetical protein